MVGEEMRGRRFLFYYKQRTKEGRGDEESCQRRGEPIYLSRKGPIGQYREGRGRTPSKRTSFFHDWGDRSGGEKKSRKEAMVG